MPRIYTTGVIALQGRQIRLYGIQGVRRQGVMLSDPKAYRFRPVSLADLPRLRAWLRTPEVVRWWGDPAVFRGMVRGGGVGYH